MIIGVLEYGEVRIFDDAVAALREWGAFPRDVLSEVIVFYESDGVWLKPTSWEGPRRWYGLRRGLQRVSLSRSEILDPGVDPLALALAEASLLIPNRYVSSLQELRTKFPWPVHSHGARLNR